MPPSSRTPGAPSAYRSVLRFDMHQQAPGTLGVMVPATASPNATGAERAALLAQAREVLGPNAVLGGLSDREIQERAIRAAHPAVRLDDKTDHYIAERFRFMRELA